MCTVDNNCLTPTLKMKRCVESKTMCVKRADETMPCRKEIYAKFKQELDGLYALGEPGKSVPKL